MAVKTFFIAVAVATTIFVSLPLLCGSLAEVLM